MGFEWTPDLAVGIEIIDEEHRNLFARIEALRAACESGNEAARDEVGRTIEFLSEYIDLHFGHEEAIMREAAYAGLAEHLEEHGAYKRSFFDLKRQFETDGVSGLFLVRLRKNIHDWLREHVLRTDMAFARTMRAVATTPRR